MNNLKPHFDGKIFINPTMPYMQHSFFTGLKMWLTSPKAKWPAYVENTAQPNLPSKLDPNQVAITFVNHATFLIQFAGLNILTDPIWSKRASPFSFMGPARVREPGIPFAELPKIDLVLISHNHYDHLDIQTLRDLNEKFAPMVIAPIGDKPLLESIGLKNVHDLDWWQDIQINENTTITFTPTQHFSARSLFDQCKSLWGGYVIKSHDKLVYFGGDAGYAKYYTEIFQKFGSMDIALLGIGAYEPSWFMRPMHMNPAEAVVAHLDLQSKHSIAMHFGTFQLSAEGIDQPPRDLKLALESKNVPTDNFIVLQDGETKIYS